MKLDHEDGASIDLTLTVTDAGGLTGTAEVTITVTDINEAPVAVGMVKPVTGTAGAAIKSEPIDLLALFDDPDASDSDAVRYELSGAPSWLTFSVQYGEDDDGNDTTHGIFTGTPPTTGAESDKATMVTLTATDSGGAEASLSFHVIVDDGNDDITSVQLIDSDGKVAVEADVDENDDSGVVLGEIRVTDPDDHRHPNGMHQIDILKAEQTPRNVKAELDNRFEVKYDDAGVPWLALKAGMSLDEETNGGAVDVIIRAVDIGGATNAKGDEFTGDVESQVVTIVIADKNDAPKANTIGNWWVTTEDDLKSDEIDKGEWLTFDLDTDGADAAFTDPDGDTLTYTLEGPSILEINSRTGRITNTEGGVPVRGVHTLTVTASDGKGGTAETNFKLAIGFSDPGTNFTEDNEEPEIRVTSDVDYVENSGERRVATFTVTDEDNDLGHHPFALNSVRITSVVNADSDTDTNNRTDGTGSPFNVSAQQMTTTGYGGAFRLSDPVKNGDTWTYELWVRDTNPATTGANNDSTAILNPDPAAPAIGVDEITVTVTASDGQHTVTEDIDINIDDANDLPAAPAGNAPPVASGTYGVSQSEPQKEILYIKLEDVWSDAEDDSDDLSFSASVSGGWIKILHGPAEWSDIEDGRDGDSGTSDDVGWNVTDPDDDGTDEQTAVVIANADNADEPGTGEQVVIIELDRTGSNNGQGEKGSFTLTATDRDGGTRIKTYTITPTDENLSPSADAVEISGSAREDATLRASFNDDKDPDLRGDAMPALVLYQWYRVDGDGTATLSRQGTDNTYKLTQADVGSSIQVRVSYYEVFQGQLVPLDETIDLNSAETGLQTAQAMTSRIVSNTPDKGTGSITILANTNALVVTSRDMRVTDGDYVRTDNPFGVVPETGEDSLTISWQVSDNGRGGWKTVTQTETGADRLSLEIDADAEAAGDDGNGQSKWYRAVATYDADGPDGDDDMESVYSDPVQVANIIDAAAPTPAPTITGSAFPGGTLTVDAGTATVDVQWQTSRGGTGDWTDIPGATGSLTLTSAHVGANIRAVVSYQSTSATSPGVTAVVAVNANDGDAIPGGTTATATPAQVDDYDIEVGVMGTGHHPRLGVPGATVNNNADWNLSHTEEIDLSKLFEDPDSSRLTYTVGSTGDGLGDVTAMGGAYVYDGTDANGGVLVLEIRGSTAKLTFNSDVYRTHDGNAADGQGNVLTLTINASDGTNASDPDADINLRINVAPTGIVFNNEADGTGSQLGTAASAITVDEHVGPNAAPSPGGQFIARVDVLDQNSTTHKFGTHDVQISGDDRFIITNTGNGKTDGAEGDPARPDGSTWEVRLNAGEKLDFETQKDMDPMLEGKQIVLTLTATDGGGLSTPPGAANAIKLTITVNDIDRDGPDDILTTVADNDINHPPAAMPNNVPGLNDDETTTPGTGNTEDATSERTDDGTDDDTDGGAYPDPSMDAMMMSTLDDGLF